MVTFIQRCFFCLSTLLHCLLFLEMKRVSDHRDGNYDGCFSKADLFIAVRVSDHIELSDQNRGEI